MYVCSTYSLIKELPLAFPSVHATQAVPADVVALVPKYSLLPDVMQSSEAENTMSHTLFSDIKCLGSRTSIPTS